MIKIRRTGAGNTVEFNVTIRNAAGASSHEVTMSRQDYERLSASRHTPESCIEAAFRLLLDREPKESTLRRFDIKGPEQG